MEKKWWFSKKNEPAQDYDDYNNDYYGEASASSDVPAEDEAYDNADAGDVSVVLSAPEKDEPLMKRTFTPSTCEDSQEIVDAFKEGRVVVICIEELDKPNFMRLFDYVMGAVQALDGQFDRINRDTAVLYPYGVDKDIDVYELEEIIEDGEEFEDEADSEDLD